MRQSLKVSAPTIAACLLLAACGSSAGNKAAGSSSNAAGAAQTSSARATVRSAPSSLGTLLVDAHGMTLYHLSGEQNGKFICTSAACVGVWHPLMAPSNGTPNGDVSSLGTVKRPEGSLQVTYKGTPLYTFAQDKQPGDTKGQGIKDVGTWSVVSTGSSSGSSSTSSASGGEKPSTGGSSGGGYGR